MDLFLTLLVVFVIVSWPRVGYLRYYILLAFGIFILFIALLFAPILFLSPLFYLGMAVFLVLFIFKGIARGGKGKE
jgi:hypothetical protein